MLLPSAMNKNKKPSLKVPPFRFENHTLDMQEIDEGDPLKDAKKCEKMVEDFVMMRKAELMRKRDVISCFYPNLHPAIKICFLTIVIMPANTRVELKEKEPPFVP